MTHIYGGLDDTLRFMNDTQVADYILGMARRYPQLNSNTKLNTLASQYAGNSTLSFVALGGLEDYIYRENRSTLEAWAMTCQSYSRMVRNQTGFVGGLEDTLRFMNNTQVADYIIAMSKTFPELNSNTKLDKLTLQFQNASLSFLEQSSHPVSLFTEPRSTLINFALTCEKYYRTEKNLHLMGGLDDMVGTMTDEELIDYITKKAKEFTALDTIPKIAALRQKYGISFIPRSTSS